MNVRVRGTAKAAMVVLASLVLAGAVVTGGAAAKGKEPEVVCKRIGKKKVSCPKKELHGKRGKAGPSGPAGAPGPAGPAGAPGANGVGIPLIFRGGAPTPSVPILNVGGLSISASCSESSVTTLTGNPVLPGSILRVTGISSNTYIASNDTPAGGRYPLSAGGEDNYLLTFLAGNGSTIVTANYGVADGGLGLVNVACAAFGTVELAAG
jgi:hypothetical protein